MPNTLSAMRLFDPLKASKAEAQVEVLRHKRQWLNMPRPLFELAAHGWNLPAPRAAQAAFLLLKAHRAFGSSPAKAEAEWRAFYAALKSAFPRETFDPGRAAQLEIKARSEAASLEAIADWHSEVYALSRERAREAAFYRAEAARHFEQWARGGGSSLKQYEAELFKAHAALRAAVAPDEMELV